MTESRSEAVSGPATDTVVEAAGVAVQRAQDYLLSVQHPEGYWSGELETNACMAAEYMLLTHFLGVADRRRWDKIVNHLRRQQLADGTWSIHDFINYHLYRDYFPLMALGRHLTFMRGGYFWAAGPRT